MHIKCVIIPYCSIHFDHTLCRLGDHQILYWNKHLSRLLITVILIIGITSTVNLSSCTIFEFIKRVSK